MTLVVKDGGKRKKEFDENKFDRFIERVLPELTGDQKQEFVDSIKREVMNKDVVDAKQITNIMLLKGQERISIDSPDFTFKTAKIFLNDLYKQASVNRAYDTKEKYGSFLGLLKTLGTKGVYSEDILREYTEEEIRELETYIDYKKDELFTYIGIVSLASRYLAKDKSKEVFELPQERFMVIAMTLMMGESKNKRTELVKEAYWALSNLYMTVATPTLSNSGKGRGQLSSCFIDTVDDSLQGIYDSNTDIANLSKTGGGIGVYMGKVRSRGSDIDGYKGVSSGVIPWMKQLNNTAVSVDQLGQRKGAIAVYLDIWHKDIDNFLDAKLNNGDERLRTHDLHTGTCIPDLYMEILEERGDWFLFDPHEIRRVMGFSLEDYYDEHETFDEEGNRIISGSFREKYWQCVDNDELTKRRVPAIEIMKRILRSQLETGETYMFYRDQVNRMNANKHAGMIYCSNLCTEITQNQSPTVTIQTTTLDGNILIVKKPGDFVVCNLSSVALARAETDGVMERLIAVEVRMLDNVIDANNIPVLQAQMSNQKYRGIGLGTYGWHHLLALKGIRWESEEAVEFADKLYENIAYYAIKTSMELSKEKGAYPAFEGSDWSNGDYFVRRGYVTREKGKLVAVEGKERWLELANHVMKYGIRNGYIMAVAPNASTALIAGSTNGIDPIFRKEYSEEKKDYKIPVVVPDFNSETNWFYKSAYHIDQLWSIRQNARRQIHVDQSVSLNLYVPNTIKAKDLLNLHMEAWKNGLKTTYYVRSTSEQTIEECDSCQ